MLIALILNQSRSAIISYLLIAIFNLLFIYKNRYKKYFMPIFILITLMILVIILNQNELLMNQGSDISAQSRIPMIITGLRYFIRNPFGTFNYNHELINFHLPYSNSIINLIMLNTTHNHTLNIMIYYGILGGIVIFMFYKLLLIKFIKESQKSIYSIALFSSIAGYFLNSMFHNPGILSPDPVLWIIIICFIKNNTYKVKLT
jgi:hypothetical protein